MQRAVYLVLHVFNINNALSQQAIGTGSSSRVMRRQTDDASATNARTRGNELFKAGDFEKAIRFYQVSANLHDPGAKDLGKVYQNIALCQLKLKHYQACIETATKALAVDSGLNKARRHRGIARYHLGQSGAALGDLRNCSGLNKSDKKVKEKLIRISETSSARKPANTQSQANSKTNAARQTKPPPKSAESGNGSNGKSKSAVQAGTHSDSLSPRIERSESSGTSSTPKMAPSKASGQPLESKSESTLSGLEPTVVTPTSVNGSSSVYVNPRRVVKLSFTPEIHPSAKTSAPQSPRTIVLSTKLGSKERKQENIVKGNERASSLHLQKLEINKLWTQYDLLPGADAGMVPGDIWYVVDQKWWSIWASSSGYLNKKVSRGELELGPEPLHPSCINNEHLVLEEDVQASYTVESDCKIEDKSQNLQEGSPAYLRLKPGLREGRDFALVPEQVWNALQAWYGGGPALPRRVVPSGFDDDTESDTDRNEGDKESIVRCSIALYPEAGTLREQLEQKELQGRANSGQIGDETGVKNAGLHADADADDDDDDDGEEQGETKFEEDYDMRTESLILQPDSAAAAIAAATAAIDSLSLNESISKQPNSNHSQKRANIGDLSSSTAVQMICAKCLKNVNGKKRCKRCQSASYCSRECQKEHWKEHRSKCRTISEGETCGEKGNTLGTEMTWARKNLAMGRRGLYNLGNTCFMNSIIQCLSHTRPLTEYFLGGKWKQNGHQNIDNPLGFGGVIADGWASLLEKLWRSPNGASALDPRKFKRAVGKLAQGRFSGFQQHDSQEMLIFLLDGLHEDVNLIRKKPYVENQESDGSDPDIEVADRMWEDYCRRNKSIVVDTVTGQYKSTLKCPQCNRVSITFDPFQYVTLSLPSTRVRTITVTVVRHPSRYLKADPSTSRALRHTVTVKARDRCSAIKQQIERDLGLPSENLHLLDIYESGVYQIFQENASVSKIRKHDEVVCYESVEPQERKKSGKRYREKEKPLTHLVVLHKIPKGASSASMQNDNRGFRWGIPLCMSFESGAITGKNLKKHIVGSLYDLGMARVDIDGQNGERLDLSDIKVVLHKCNKDGRPIESNGYGTDLDAGSQNSDFDGSDCSDSDLDTDSIATTPGAIERYLGCQPDRITWVCLNWNTKLQEQLCGFSGGVPKKLLMKMSKLPAAGAKTSNNNFDASGKKISDIHHCLREFSKPETLDRDNLWYCSKCKEHVQATKTMQLMRLPEVLILHLKRFEWNNIFFSEKVRGICVHIFSLLSRYFENNRSSFISSLLFEIFFLSFLDQHIH